MSLPKNSKKAKINLAVFYGGRSVEHEISIITALQAMDALDPEKYNMIPVYIDFTGKWFTGKVLYKREFYKSFDASHPDVKEITLLPTPGINGLIICKNGMPTDKKIPVDICFLAFHGQHGEDGCMQGLMELADIPYTGSGVSASAVSMHKQFCKTVLNAAGIPVLPAATITKNEAITSLSDVCKKIHNTPGLENFPLFVKPCCLGSSIGISPARNLSELHAGLAKVFQYDELALIEPYIQDLVEVNIGVLDGKEVKASVVEIPQSSRESGALSYEDKYMRRDNKMAITRQGMASLPRIIDPESLPLSVKATITQYALTAFKVLGCSGLARLDFMIDTSKNQIYFNELNPLPGSLAFYLWDRIDPPMLYTQILDKIIDRAFEKKTMRLSLQHNLGFRAL